MRRTIYFLILLLLFTLSACSNNSQNTSLVNENTSLVNEKPKTTSTPSLEGILSDEKYQDNSESEEEFMEDIASFQEDLNEVGGTLIEQNDTGNYSASNATIWQYCMDRWEYYDALEGGYSGDKYTDQVFQDAGEKFGISANKAQQIWSEVDKEKYGLD